jgi:hypothetical protein
MLQVRDGLSETNRGPPNREPAQMTIQGVADIGGSSKDLSASSHRSNCRSEAGARSVPAASQDPCHSIESATQALAALPYIRHAESGAPDYWALPATGGYESGYTVGMEMAESCQSYLRRSPSDDAGANDGYTHLLLVVTRLAERIQGALGTDPMGEASMTLKGHLAGFCSALEANLRRPLRPRSDGPDGRGPGGPGHAVSSAKTDLPVRRTPGRGKRCR